MSQLKRAITSGLTCLFLPDPVRTDMGKEGTIAFGSHAGMQHDMMMMMMMMMMNDSQPLCHS